MVNIKRLRDDVELPRYESNGAAGFDLATAVDVVVHPSVISLIPTGLVIETPADHMLLLVLRSSAPRKWDITMPHGIGIVDEDYCGNGDELKIQVMGIAGRGDRTLIPAHTKIAQGIFVPVRRAEFQEVQDMTQQTRGGFGSTG